jgi:hypothetical protein
MHQVASDAHRALCAAHDAEHGERQGEQRADQHQRRTRAALAGEEQREQDERGEVGDRSARDHELPEAGADPARVLEHRDQDAERRRAERDRHEERRLDEPAGGQRERRGDGER